MYRLFVLLGTLTFCGGCDKQVTPTIPSATELLTQKEWMLTNYGFDENKNGIIDISEESARDCEKDNRYLFIANGTGQVYDNMLTCGNGVSDHTFNWKFINNETTLDFVVGLTHILKLNKNELIVYHDSNDGNESTRFIMYFRH